jgi:uncharacterized protein YecE (DUF72 family)
MALKTHGIVRIGTSNVTVPGNKSSFPEAFREKSRLYYYSHIFNTVEVNSSFYKTPRLSTYEKWVEEVREGFQFSIKLSKTITHAKELDTDLAGINPFLTAASGLGRKKGCLLVQFPGKINLDDYGKVETILEKLSKYDPQQQWRKAVEFRHPSWYTGETYELLDEYSASMVLHDIPKARLMEFNGKASFVYIRFHGPKGDYRGSYSDDVLKASAEQVKEWVTKGKDVYAYFNNTAGSAFDNAIYLQTVFKK